MISRTRLLVVIGAVMIVAGVTLYGVTRNSGHPDAPAAAAANGPLFIESGVDYWEPLKIGQVAVFSEPPIENHSTQPLVIDRVTLRISNKGTAALDSTTPPLIGLPQRAFGGGILNQPLNKKDDGPWEPYAGAVIQPNADVTTHGQQGYGLIFALKVDSLGIAWSTGVDVFYHVGVKKYEAHSDDLFVICTTVTTECKSAYQKVAGTQAS